MKKFLISIIVILVFVLIGQLVYFNKKPTTNTNIQNEIVTKKLANYLDPEKEQANSTSEMTVKDTIIPINMANLSQQYNGDTKLMLLERLLYNFINKDVKNIYNMTTGKSKNQILQTYDLNKQEINNMNIYSKEDFSVIASQIFNIGTKKYINTEIVMESYKPNENGYTTFNLIIRYEGYEFTIKVCLANNTGIGPSIRFEKQ